MGTLANSEDPDEMPQNAAFNQGLQCLLRQDRNILEIITCDPSIYGPLQGFAYNKGADQRAHPCSLINTFVVHFL